MKARRKIVVGALLTPLLVGIPVLVSGIRQHKKKRCKLESDLTATEWTDCKPFDNKTDFEIKSETHMQSNNFYPGLSPIIPFLTNLARSGNNGKDLYT